jgi:hypothetical protein
MEQSVTKPSIIRPVRQGSFLRNRLILYLFLIPACLALPFLISPYLNAQSNCMGGMLLLPWGLSCIFFVNLISNFSEYRKAVHLDQDGIQILVPVKAKYDERARRSSPYGGGDEFSLIFGLFKYKIYILEYELPGFSRCWGYVSEKVYLNNQVGQMVAVRYLSDDPGIQRIESVGEPLNKIHSSEPHLQPTVTPAEKLSTFSITDGQTELMNADGVSHVSDNKTAGLRAKDFLMYLVFMLIGWSLGYLTGYFAFSNALLGLWGSPEPLNDMTLYVVDFICCSLPLMALSVIPTILIGRKIIKQNAKKLIAFIMVVSFMCGFALYFPMILMILIGYAF